MTKYNTIQTKNKKQKTTTSCMHVQNNKHTWIQQPTTTTAWQSLDGEGKLKWGRVYTGK